MLFYPKDGEMLSEFPSPLSLRRRIIVSTQPPKDAKELSAVVTEESVSQRDVALADDANSAPPAGDGTGERKDGIERNISAVISAQKVESSRDLKAGVGGVLGKSRKGGGSFKEGQKKESDPADLVAGVVDPVAKAAAEAAAASMREPQAAAVALAMPDDGASESGVAAGGSVSAREEVAEGAELNRSVSDEAKGRANLLARSFSGLMWDARREAGTEGQVRRGKGGPLGAHKKCRLRRCQNLR